ncbi:MAG: glycosyltransferase family 2 protein [Gammaproteobacteria bacterium]
MTPYSVVIITKNEAHDLPRCLDSLAGCDDVVVVDSGSTDGTADICTGRQGVRFMHRDFDGYGPQKRYAVAQARHDWVLNIDADEVLTPELSGELAELSRRDFPGAMGYQVPRSLVFMGRHFRHGRESAHYLLRLFDRRSGNFDEAPVHEKVVVEGPVHRLSGRLLHYSYRDLDEYFEKFNQYTRLSAAKMVAKGRRISAWQVALRQPVTFLQFYLFQGNWRNGFPGFVWAWLGSTYHAVKYLKAKELARKGDSG